MENKSFQIKKRITKINASISKLDVTFNIQKSEWSSKKIRKGKNIQVTNTVFKRENVISISTTYLYFEFESI